MSIGIKGKLRGTVRAGALLALTACASVALAACASVGLDFDEEPDVGVPRDQIPGTPAQPIELDMRLDRVEMAYLGSGGWLIEVDGAALMTGPLFSNPGMAQVLFGRIEPETRLINRGLDTLKTDHVEAILVGHGHYDHLLDVPATVRYHTPSADVYGSSTVSNIIAQSLPSGSDVIPIQKNQAATHDREGDWFPTTPDRFRWMAVNTKHSNHLWKIQLFKGSVDQPQSSLPTRATGWKVGDTYAYLIDILDDTGELALRVYYNDSGATWPQGFPPASTSPPDGVPTVAILTAPGYKWEKRYPEEIIDSLAPAYVIAGHWEDFFRPQDGNPRPTIGTFFGGFVERMNDLGVPWAAPDPDDRFVFVKR